MEALKAVLPLIVGWPLLTYCSEQDGVGTTSASAWPRTEQIRRHPPEEEDWLNDDYLPP